ncbi:hypothetical protein CAPTEDRAFT_221431 [Capitella teleta]|uniref:SSD domain-containing protein n=1 Tax=Capitella teleta TaxID=283909 RepID=R7V1K2_CAPTE|nr:hypothetical protein CAPTEDRAFT_221431 [Capitella teleta]|eukprot:ELU10067.1 hypothetical protein CAPTEDRAFT_221431 [Capitella teleta]
MNNRDLYDDDDMLIPDLRSTEHIDDDELLGRNEPPVVTSPSEDLSKYNPLIRRFSYLVVRFPYIFPILIIFLAIACGLLSFYHFPIPDFSDPTKGFQTRGTEISKRVSTLDRIDKQQSGYTYTPNAEPSIDNSGKRSARSTSKECIGLRQNPNNFATFIFEPTSSSFDLMDEDQMQSVCRLERKIIHDLLGFTCDPVSLVHFTTHSKQPMCEDIFKSDVEATRELLLEWAPFYYDHQHASLPGEVYDMMYFILPDDYLKHDNNTKLKFVASYIQQNRLLNWKDIYMKHFDKKTYTDGHVKLAAIGFPGEVLYISTKLDIFSEYLLIDAVYFALAAGLVFMVMLLYLRSLLLTIATILNVGMSFLISYVVYLGLPGVKFFPFFNILAALILIALGADDVFIFHDTWVQAKQESNHMGHSLHGIMCKTFSHAAASVFVTSFTTTAAFFANTVSHITDIQCFGIFAGICILTNFILTITWTPSIIVLSEITWTNFQRKCFTRPPKCYKRLQSLSRIPDFIYGKAFPSLMEKCWYCVTAILLVFGILSCVAVFYKPRLQLPETSGFQLFQSGNIMERMDTFYNKHLQYRKDKASRNIQVYFVWGFIPEDSGNHLNPDDTGGELKMDATFDLFDAQSFEWLLSFCNALRTVEWAIAPPTSTCQLSKYANFIQTNCSAPTETRHSCCDQSTNHSQLAACAPVIDSRYDGETLGTALYDADNNIKGYVMKMKTTLEEVDNYQTMDANYKTFEQFITKHLRNAPPGAKNMFFSTWYQFHNFYDLVKSISSSVYYSIILSVSVAFIVMFLTTMNLIITIYAIISIGFAIAATVACLVFLGWHLNIVESMTLSLAVGLSIDFTIHYGVAYRWSPASTSQGRTRESYKRVGPAVAVGALTTFLAGAAVLPSSIRSYTQIGTFLMLVMTFSWIYSTFFFQSVCHIIGPKRNFCQVLKSCLKRSSRTSNVLSLMQENHGDQTSVSSDEEPLLYSDYTVDEMVRGHLVIDDAPSRVTTRPRNVSTLRDPASPDDESQFYHL